MPTRITTAVQGRRGDSGSASHLVQENFETVLNAVLPLSAPSSALEARSAYTFTAAHGGGRIFVAPSSITCIEEDADDDDE